ncbi:MULTISPECIES: carboxylesterase family protein [unclassified Streptomyces]|uniref:carboxylesterase/lipase family protein n=1 Tax=unclassified Streptomyces TaxID=2593676 RepID=UPI000DB9DA88|nr:MULTISPECIES: carboxylesterase family protein [unclassified Streptomyces]MYT74454.1 carboxylesterase family protein [Streptomyces sp. SID8367]RAJ91432.1 carboxylesterase type B [Streptomyces sp. PsTaAH-137]
MTPVVTTAQGTLRGHTDAQGIASFLGIPYAAPPFGPRRFRAPAPAEPWTGERDATGYGPTAPKAPYTPPFDALIPETSVPGEDCLNLNVWTPEPGPGARLPVLVWLHGGSFSNGSANSSGYRGETFARDGVVFVGVNYRLGTDGFLHLPGAPDNRGLLDQIAALEWVRDNIAAFGGDPDRVTVFGESAGGMAIGQLLAHPGARGLLRRAVLQSGACHHFVRPETARSIGARLAEKLGVPHTAEAFAAVPMPELLTAQAALPMDLVTRPDPAVWGEATLNAMVFEPVADGLALPGPDLGVDLLVGSNREENRLFMVPTGRFHSITEERARRGATAYGADYDAYRAGRPGAEPGELLEAIGTDWFYRIPAVRLAESVPGSHLYEFAWRSPQFDGELGACHALELGFVFDLLDDPDYLPMAGEKAPGELARTMHAVWVAFAATGDPGWAAYDPAGERTTMVFDADGCRTESDPRAAERKLWQDVR